MNTPTLIQRIDNTAFSDQSVRNFLNMVDTSVDDEDGVVILIAAATLLARECQGDGEERDIAVCRLGGQFIELMFAVQGEMHAAATAPRFDLMGDARV